MQNLFQDLGKKRLSTKKFHEIIVEAFFISTMNGDCLNAIHMQKNVIFMPQQLPNRPQPYLLMHLITVTLILMTNFSMCQVTYSVKVSLVFKKSAKQAKSILVAVQDLKIFGIDLFLNILNLSIPLNLI